MDLVVMFVLVAVTAALIIGPFLRAPRPAPTGLRAPEREVAHNKASALGAIRELEFDFATGKLSDEDYAALRARYEAKAVEVLSRPTRQVPAVDAAARIEAEIAAARARRRRRVPDGAPRCASCGEGLPAAARFCPVCGTPVGGVGP